ncbi:patatin-like phospholipase family protein [Devosia marina]|uniref:Patatin n=1 Tax=Devosia marina TaxID=2683198 RepID=A0A7X3FUU2_9HYPH|nr:patatin [Devosia marina]
MDRKIFRILSLDGGGAKGFYTLGVLKEVEALAGKKLHEQFDLIYGTSTGAIITALLGLGYSVSNIIDLYRLHVVSVMAARGRQRKSAALAKLGHDIFAAARFEDFLTGVGIVSAKWVIERPMIFKSGFNQAHGRRATFVPGFGCTVSDAVQASCSAYPFFDRKLVVTGSGEKVELIDGGYCANNPTLYAIADAVKAMEIPVENLRVLSVGVGEYPPKLISPFQPMHWLNKVPEVQLLQKTFDISTQSMEQLRSVLFGNVHTVRVNDAFVSPDMATDIFEHDLDKLSILIQRGSESFASKEKDISRLLI